MKISIITATFNCEKYIKNLISCMEVLEDENFEWVIVDGGSIDETLSILREANVPDMKIHSGEDFGIYDALNKGIRIATGDYYLCLGADDFIYPDALCNFRRELQHVAFDFVAAAVKCDEIVLKPGLGSVWRRGGNAHIASHAVGTLIKRSLHSDCGFYKNKYPNCADMYFLMFALIKKNKTIRYANFVSGEFGSDGISSVDKAMSMTDAYRVSRDVGLGFWIPTIVLFYRLIRFSR